MTWDGICEHGLLLDTYCEECDKPPMTDLREVIARALATANGHNPDESLKILWRSPDVRDDEVMRVWHEYVEEADAALAAIEAAGWQCVPKEPTEEMIEAAFPMEQHIGKPTHIWPVGVWNYMLAAAPKPGGEK